MKIALNMDNLGKGSAKNEETQAVERLLSAARDGDFAARDMLVQHYMPLLTSMAKKRSHEVKEINSLIDRGKEGLALAAKKSKPSMDAAKFKLFALDFIEKSMDKSGGGFFSKLFGK